MKALSPGRIYTGNNQSSQVPCPKSHRQTDKVDEDEVVERRE